MGIPLDPNSVSVYLPLVLTESMCTRLNNLLRRRMRTREILKTTPGAYCPMFRVSLHHPLLHTPPQLLLWLALCWPSFPSNMIFWYDY